VERRPWTSDDIARLACMAQKYPTSEIAKALGRGLSATVMKAHTLRISLRLVPKGGSRKADGADATSVRSEQKNALRLEERSLK
jgi:hypothetical protein